MYVHKDRRSHQVPGSSQFAFCSLPKLKILAGESKMSLKRHDLMRKRIANNAKIEMGFLKRFHAFIH